MTLIRQLLYVFAALLMGYVYGLGQGQVAGLMECKYNITSSNLEIYDRLENVELKNRISVLNLEIEGLLGSLSTPMNQEKTSNIKKRNKQYEQFYVRQQRRPIENSGSSDGR